MNLSQRLQNIRDRIDQLRAGLENNNSSVWESGQGAVLNDDKHLGDVEVATPNTNNTTSSNSSNSSSSAADLKAKLLKKRTPDSTQD